MNLAVSAERNGVARVTAYRWFRAGLLQVPARRVHRDRFCRFGSESVQAAVAAQGRAVVVVDSAEVADDLVRDMTVILTSMCARLCGERAAQNRAKRAVAAAAEMIARWRDGEIWGS